MEVEIYSKTNCVFCDKAKMRLSKENPKIHMLDEDYTREDFFKKFKVVNSIVPISIALFANSLPCLLTISICLCRSTSQHKTHIIFEISKHQKSKNLKL